MCGSHCSVCPASPLGGRGERVPALTILKWPPAVTRALGLFMEAPPCMSTNVARGNLQDWGIRSLRGSFWPLFVTRGGSPFRNASHKLEIWSHQKSPFSLIFKFSKPAAFVLGCYMIPTHILKFEGKSLWNFLCCENGWCWEPYICLDYLPHAKTPTLLCLSPPAVRAEPQSAVLKRWDPAWGQVNSPHWSKGTQSWARGNRNF